MICLHCERDSGAKSHRSRGLSLGCVEWLAHNAADKIRHGEHHAMPGLVPTLIAPRAQRPHGEEARSAVSNHEVIGLILRDAVKGPLLRMRD
jgi:hypothetical protein